LQLVKANSSNDVLRNIIFRDIQKIEDSKKMLMAYVKEQAVYEELAFYFVNRK